MRADTPQDVWLYNSAGLEYADVGDHETALAWLSDGLELALRSGDPQRLVAQLAELRAESLHALGRSDDALQERAAGFARERAAGFARERDAGRAAARSTAVSAGSNDSARHGATALAWAWLPADDYAVAAALWPDLAESDLLTSPDGPVGHAQYCRALQARLVEASVAGLSGLMIAPVRVPAFSAWCAERGRAPDSPSRAEYAAQLAAASDPAVIGWPPGRNEPCWCGSGRKYKKCCAASAFADPGRR